MADSLPERALNQQSVESDDEKFNASLKSIGDINTEVGSPKAASSSESIPSRRQDSSHIPGVSSNLPPGSSKLDSSKDVSETTTNRVDFTATRQSSGSL